MKIYSNIIVKNPNNEILFLKRSSVDGFEPNKWCVPGGSKEVGETILEAAIRELYEETGLTVERTAYNPYPLGKVQNDAGEHHYFEYYDANYPNPVLNIKEHQQYCWLTMFEALEQLDFLKTMGTDIHKLLIK